MLREVLELLDLREGGAYVDATVGPGGHSEGILARLGPDGFLICMDRDEEALEEARARLSDDRLRFVHARFSELADVLKDLGISQVDGVIMDFGVSMLQLKAPGRGFSFSSDDSLDMRMDQSRGVTAREVVNKWPEKDLAGIIYEYGQERRSRRIAAAILRARRKRPLETGAELAEIVATSVGRGGRTHPATRTFQALRIAVNSEMEEIDRGLESALEVLRPGARLVTIAYHSLEDGKVKRFMKAASRSGRLGLLTPKPLIPGRDELRENPSARSAKLRAAEAL
jgi:16S rRNA (cytosine1402-N4)-methyltransferase